MKKKYDRKLFELKHEGIISDKQNIKNFKHEKRNMFRTHFEKLKIWNPIICQFANFVLMPRKSINHLWDGVPFFSQADSAELLEGGCKKK